MENTTQGKKPAEWFAQLKEPYRSQAIENIDDKCIGFVEYPKSLREAIMESYSWRTTKQGEHYWGMIHNSITAGETTYLEPEQIGNADNLKPEQMQSGKWYVINNIWLEKFKEFKDKRLYSFNSFDLEDLEHCPKGQYISYGRTDSIRPATNEEILKHFPDEKFENVSLINEVNNTQVTEQQNQIESEKVEVDWKSKFEELQKDYDNLNFTYQNFMKIYEEQDLAYDALADKYSKLELQQNNQEKVYIHYNNKQEKWLQADTLQLALQESPENKNIYEAVKIGVKKSILVNENA